jgi:hypothetical protein
MDRAIYRLITFAAIVLVFAYVYLHSNSIENAIRSGVTDWWH